MRVIPSGAVRRALLCLGLPAAMGACALTFDAHSLGVPVTMAAAAVFVLALAVCVPATRAQEEDFFHPENP